MVEGVLGGRGDAGERDEIDESAARMLEAMADRRAGGEPLQYVLGSWQFRALDLLVDVRALIPRPETEQVVEVALAEARRQVALQPADPGDAPLVVADLGTGTGAIALSIAVELGSPPGGRPSPDRPSPDRRPLPPVRVLGTDVDAGALELATANRARVAETHPAAATVELVCGSWFEALPAGLRGRLGLVVSNPPYVSEEEWSGLDPEVRREPYTALVAPAGSDGTPGFAGVETVVSGAFEWLAPAAAVVVELAPHHAPVAAALARRSGYGDVRVEADLAGRPRAVVARK